MKPLGYRPATCEYTVTEADNGLIFSTYDVSSDEMTYRIAKTAFELGEIIREWQEQRISQMIQYQSRERTGVLNIDPVALRKVSE